MKAELLRGFKELERENAELKRMYADLSLDHLILKNIIEKSFSALSKEGSGDGDKSGRGFVCCQGV